MNALCPGYLDSHITNAEQALRAMVTEQHPGRFGEEAELDITLLFLASPPLRT